MRLAKINQRKTSFEFPPGGIGYLDWRYRSMWILEHLDEVDSSVSRTQLILDAALLTEHLGLDLLGSAGHLVRGHPSGREHIQAANQRHRDSGRCAGGGPTGSFGINGHFETKAGWQMHIFNGRFK